MADRIITVTNPSVVTNDTLASYNNYTNQPSPNTLIGPMTIGEAAAGKTVSLSDGVVHEVTTKPVGTTNGEFAAVVSNAVTVDLSSGGTPEAVDFTGNMISIAPTGEDYIVSTTSYLGRGRSAVIRTGDFDYRCTVDEAGVTNNWMIGISSQASNVAYNDATNPWEFVAFMNQAKTVIRYKIGSGSIVDTVQVPDYTAGDVVRIVRVSDNVKMYYNDVELLDAGTISGSFYLMVSAFQSPNLCREPRVIE